MIFVALLSMQVSGTLDEFSMKAPWTAFPSSPWPIISTAPENQGRGREGRHSVRFHRGVLPGGVGYEPSKSLPAYRRGRDHGQFVYRGRQTNPRTSNPPSRKTPGRKTKNSMAEGRGDRPRGQGYRMNDQWGICAASYPLLDKVCNPNRRRYFPEHNNFSYARGRKGHCGGWQQFGSPRWRCSRPRGERKSLGSLPGHLTGNWRAISDARNGFLLLDGY